MNQIRGAFGDMVDGDGKLCFDAADHEARSLDSSVFDDEEYDTRYATYSLDFIAALQAAYFDGADLGALFGMDRETAAIIVAETLDAEQMLAGLRSTAESGVPFALATDYSRAVLAEALLSAAHGLRAAGEATAQEANAWWATAMTLLEEITESPTASPLLWYEDIYNDLAEAALGGSAGEQERALRWMEAGLAYHLEYGAGVLALDYALDLAAATMQIGRYDEAFRIYEGLLRGGAADPALCRAIAEDLGDAGFREVGLQLARRGHEVLDSLAATEDPTVVRAIREDLERVVGELSAMDPECPEPPVDHNVRAPLIGASAPSSTSTRETVAAAFWSALIPGIDRIPLKRPLRLEDLPEGVRALLG